MSDFLIFFLIFFFHFKLELFYKEIKITRLQLVKKSVIQKDELGEERGIRSRLV